jgi:hypothetical protein
MSVAELELRFWSMDAAVYCCRNRYQPCHVEDGRTKWSGREPGLWITIDSNRAIIEEKSNIDRNPTNLDQKIQIMKTTGYDPVELRIMEGSLFSGEPEPSWFWLIGRK